MILLIISVFFQDNLINVLRVYKKLEYDVYEQNIYIKENTDENNIMYQLSQDMVKVELKKSRKKKKKRRAI